MADDLSNVQEPRADDLGISSDDTIPFQTDVFVEGPPE